MSVLLLDSRWPTLIPVEALVTLRGQVRYTDEVPISVRWNLGEILSAEESALAGPDVLVSTDPNNPEVQHRIQAGEAVIKADSLDDSVAEAVAVMSRARSIGEWEASCTHKSLVKCLREETEEFAQAVERWSSTNEKENAEAQLRDELGDILLQVLFHAEIASRRGAFDFGDVARAFVAKMRSRSPYLFDGTSTTVPLEEQERLWKLGKQSTSQGDS